MVTSPWHSNGPGIILKTLPISPLQIFRRKVVQIWSCRNIPSINSWWIIDHFGNSLKRRNLALCGSFSTHQHLFLCFSWIHLYFRKCGLQSYKTFINWQWSYDYGRRDCKGWLEMKIHYSLSQITPTWSFQLSWETPHWI